MEINKFIKKFIKKMEKIDSDEIILATWKDKEDDEPRYKDGEVTFMFNCAVFDIIREEKEEKNTNLQIEVEPISEQPRGRGGYSDLAIVSIDENDYKTTHILIEHENDPEGKVKGGQGNKLGWCIKKLAEKRKVKDKLLIAYHSKWSPEKLEEETKKYVNKHFKTGKLHLLSCPWYGDIRYKIIDFEPQ